MNKKKRSTSMDNGKHSNKWFVGATLVGWLLFIVVIFLGESLMRSPDTEKTVSDVVIEQADDLPNDDVSGDSNDLDVSGDDASDEGVSDSGDSDVSNEDEQEVASFDGITESQKDAVREIVKNIEKDIE